MKDRHTFISGYVIFYIVGTFLFTALIVSVNVFNYFSEYYSETIKFTFLFPLLLVAGTLAEFQYVTIDENEIIVHGLFHIIQQKRWAEIRSIKIDMLPDEGQIGMYFVFKDGSSNKPKKGFKIRKNTLIKLAYSERRLKILEKYWGKEIKVNLDD